MRWTVQGADASKGQDVCMTIEADTREQAEAQARYNGILVSSISPETEQPEPAASSTLEYARPTTVASAPAAVPVALPYFAHVREAPQYRQIVAGARWLKRIGWVCMALGLLSLLSGMFNGIDLFLPRRFNPVRLMRLVEMFWFGAVLTGTGLFFHLFSSVALAVRDMAGNSYRQKSDTGA